MYKFSSLILIFILSFVNYAQHDVKWSYTNGYNYNPSTNALQKNAGSNWSHAAFSHNKLKAEENGSVSHTVVNTTQSFFVGLTTSSSGNYTAIKFAANQNGTDLRIFEDGVFIKIISNILAAGDIITVERTGANVYYSRTRGSDKTVYHTSSSPVNIYDELSAAICSFHNGSILSNITSTFGYIDCDASLIHIDLENNLLTGSITISNVTGAVTPYMVSWSINGTGNNLTNLQAGTYTLTITDFLGGVEEKEYVIGYKTKWLNTTGCNYVSSTNVLTNNTYSSWCNARGHSANRLLPNINGFVEYQIETVNTQMFLGLTNSDNSTCYHQIEYSFHQQNTNFKVYENGSQKFADYGALQIGDIVKIEREGINIYYKRIRNGHSKLMYTSVSPVSPSEELFVSTRLYNVNSILSNVITSFNIPQGSTSFLLQEKLNGGYYEFNGDLLAFDYEEQYHIEGTKYLSYKLYNDQYILQAESTEAGSTASLPSSPIQSIEYGFNACALDLSGLGLSHGFYTLEVSTAKKDKLYLKFKY